MGYHVRSHVTSVLTVCLGTLPVPEHYNAGTGRILEHTIS